MASGNGARGDDRGDCTPGERCQNKVVFLWPEQPVVLAGVGVSIRTTRTPHRTLNVAVGFDALVVPDQEVDERRGAREIAGGVSLPRTVTRLPFDHPGGVFAEWLTQPLHERRVGQVGIGGNPRFVNGRGWDKPPAREEIVGRVLVGRALVRRVLAGRTLVGWTLCGATLGVA